MRFPLLLLLFLALPACTDTGTGGYAPPPEAAAWNAYGTATAAVVQVTATAVSQQATYMAAYAQATATQQVASQQATIAAAPTVTAQAEYKSVLAQGQATQDAIKADVMRAEATATAVHLQELQAWERAQTVKRAQSAQFWTVARPVFLALFALAAYKAIMVISHAAGWRFTPPPEMVEDGNGNVVAVANGYRQVVSQDRNVTITQPAPRQTQTFEIEVKTARGIITISQPSPASFRTWLREVLADGNRVQFSENESTRRGWSAEQYGHLIYELRQSFWLHDVDGNGVYRMTDAGKAQAREWLGIATPPPNE